MELYWTAARVEQSQTRLQVVGRFVPEKRMLGVAGIIKKATHEVIPLSGIGGYWRLGKSCPSL